MSIHPFIALFYYTLGNISPKYRSSLGAIQLFAVLKTNLLEKYGCNQVLERFMEDIHLLESVSSNFVLMHN